MLHLECCPSRRSRFQVRGNLSPRSQAVKWSRSTSLFVRRPNLSQSLRIRREISNGRKLRSSRLILRQCSMLRTEVPDLRSLPKISASLTLSGPSYSLPRLPWSKPPHLSKRILTTARTNVRISKRSNLRRRPYVGAETP